MTKVATGWIELRLKVIMDPMTMVWTPDYKKGKAE
jgi:hypothetical protein